MVLRSLTLGTLFVALFTCIASAAAPRLSSLEYKLDEVAREPDVVTPVGMAFDRSGRLFVIESNTHERPQDYDGPGTDRIRIFADSDGDGRLDRWTTYADGLENAMTLSTRDDGAVYVITRSSLTLVQDTDGNGTADQRQELLQLETEDKYPHNGLVGIAREPDGRLLVSMGENHGMAFRLVGAGGKEIAAEGEGGMIFRCSPDGGDLELLATGFWNPFSLCALPDGRIFTPDNDPDASPPCRLLHVVPGGDYGFRFRYGRAGNHPLQAWNGELPGTLPMICGTGEAPTAIVAHAGHLWVTSWGDHRIERYRLLPRGASYSAEREVIVQGDTDFRPTGMAVAPDGSIYFGDWVLRNYPVHGHGRIWRLTRPPHETDETISTATADVSQATEIAIASEDPFIRVAGIRDLSKRDDLESLDFGNPSDSKVRLGRLEALRLRGTNRAESLLRAALGDPSSDIRMFALRWIADDRITALRDDAAKLLDGPQPNSRYYLAVLATLDWLDNEPKMRNAGINDALLVRELKNQPRPPVLHALALELLSPDDKFLTLEQLENYLDANDSSLQLAAVRALAQQTNSDRFALLAETASDPAQSDAIRAEAISGLAAAAEVHRDLLENFATGADALLAHESDRALRLAKQRPIASEHKPAANDLSAWNDLLSQPGDAESGRRLFFSAVGARCCVCHEHDGRGGKIGPDLTHIGPKTSRERIIASILQPSQEIAPEYQSWLLVTTEGQTLAALRSAKSGDDGNEVYVDSSGKSFTLPSDKIELRQASATSIMPDGLQDTLSIADLRDLVTFLTKLSLE